MEKKNWAGYPSWTFWVAMAVVAWAGYWTREFSERLIVACPRLVWAAVTVAQKIFLDW